jgi:hypothetical protein
LDGLIGAELDGETNVSWRSPLRSDDFAEYRDECFLRRVGLERLSSELQDFWPQRGPQWDALAQLENGGVLLVEAKAHIGELWSSCKAEGSSLEKITEALNETVEFLGATPKARWTDCFYQLANRIAHLYFFRNHGINAKLVLINFVGDDDVRGPNSKAEWQAAYEIVWHVLGLPGRHDEISRHIVEIFPEVGAWPKPIMA